MSQDKTEPKPIMATIDVKPLANIQFHSQMSNIFEHLTQYQHGELKELAASKARGPGAPQKDEAREMARQLKAQGDSWTTVARKLNNEFGGNWTKDSARKLAKTESRGSLYNEVKRDDPAPSTARKRKGRRTAETQARMMITALSTMNGLCSGLDEIDLETALSACPPGDREVWLTRARELANRLRKFALRIESY